MFPPALIASTISLTVLSPCLPLMSIPSIAFLIASMFCFCLASAAFCAFLPLTVVKVSPVIVASDVLEVTVAFGVLVVIETLISVSDFLLNLRSVIVVPSFERGTFTPVSVSIALSLSLSDNLFQAATISAIVLVPWFLSFAPLNNAWIA
ncbi:MAG: hypothetical protein GY793_00865, partial [Proteobacteria bacterium]|nr:hypothetical protein [Pseudomonadota bacterium]